MLEPAVRPGQQAAGKVDTGRPAFENRSFEDLLGEAAGNAAKGQSAAGKDQVPAANPLDPLGGLSGIENAALRSVLAQGKGGA